jgi:hypothetical protein
LEKIRLLRAGGLSGGVDAAIGELDLGDDVGMIEDRGILARIEGWAGAAKLQRGDGRPYATGRGGSL